MRALRRWLAKLFERWSRLAGPSHQDYADCYLGQGDAEKMNELWRRQDRLRAIARRIAPSEREFCLVVAELEKEERRRRRR